MSSQVELCEHHTKGCLQAAEKPKTPWRARCFSGMRWSGCGTGLQHPSIRSYVLFVDARQHRDRASREHGSIRVARRILIDMAWHWARLGEEQDRATDLHKE
jgi:hypothetical protein